MKRQTNIILIVLMAVMMLMSLPGANQRYKNEKKNDTLSVSADYASFRISTDKAKIDIFDQFDKMRPYGLDTVLISNSTIRDFEADGKVSIFYYYEKADEIKPLEEKIYSNSLLLIPAQGQYSQIRSKLERRFEDGSLIYTEYNGMDAIIINAELDERVGVNMGFDEEVIKRTIQNGYRAALSMQNENFGDTAFLDETGYILNNYDISYVEINSFEFPGYRPGLEKAIELIKNSEATLMLKADYGVVDPNVTKGLYEYLYESGFNAQRTFFIKDYIPNSRITTPRDYYLRMLRAAVDRGNRFFVIAPLINIRKTHSQILDDTTMMLRLFYNRLNGSYDLGGYISGTDFDEQPTIYSYFSALSIILGALLILINAFGKIRIFYWLYGVFVLGYAAAGLFYGNYLGRLNALMGTIVFPALFAILIAEWSTKRPRKIRMPLLKITGAFFGTALLSAVCSISNLSDVYSFLGINTFVGVKLSFVVPFAVYLFAFSIRKADIREWKPRILSFAGRPVTYFSLGLLGLLAAAGYLYLARSGNDAGSLVLNFEIKAREFFEETVLVRPRTKEFLIGYPSLALLIYFFKRESKELAVFLAGAGAMVGLISLVNTFSHVNAYIMTSVTRSLYGIMLGLPAAVLLVGICYLIRVKGGEDV